MLRLWQRHVLDRGRGYGGPEEQWRLVIDDWRCDIPLAILTPRRYENAMTRMVRQAIQAGVVCSILMACGTRAPSTPLHSAVEKGDLRIVQQHIAAGTDLDAKNPSGWTALHLAAMNGNLPIVEALIAAGAKDSVTGPQGQTPLDVAREKGQTAVAEYLQARNENRGRQLIDGGAGVSEVLDLM